MEKMNVTVTSQKRLSRYSRHYFQVVLWLYAPQANTLKERIQGYDFSVGGEG